jgi:hypothetical protein
MSMKTHNKKIPLNNRGKAICSEKKSHSYKVYQTITVYKSINYTPLLIWKNHKQTIELQSDEQLNYNQTSRNYVQNACLHMKQKKKKLQVVGHNKS